jgi:branched-chain amino acid transport system permease protein
MITKLGASQLYLVGYSAVFMVVLLVLPRGIVPSLRGALDASRERRRTRGEPTVHEEAHA